MGIQRKLVSETRSALLEVHRVCSADQIVNDYIAHHKREGEGGFATFLVGTGMKKLPTCKFSPYGSNSGTKFVSYISRATCMRWVGLDTVTTVLREKVRTRLSRYILTPSRTKSTVATAFSTTC